MRVEVGEEVSSNLGDTDEIAQQIAGCGDAGDRFRMRDGRFGTLDDRRCILSQNGEGLVK